MDRERQSTERFVRVSLKNPKVDGVFDINIEANATVRELKARIEAEYPDRPRRPLITLVHAGKVLRDDGVILSDLFAGSSSLDNVIVVHMVIKQLEQVAPRAVVEATAKVEAEASETAMPTPPPPERVLEYIVDIDNRDDGDVAESRPPTEAEMPSAPAATVPVTQVAATAAVATEATAGTRLPASSGSTVYDAVLKSSYQAALQAIMSDTTASHAGGFTFIPAMIPVPRSAVEVPRRNRSRDGRDAPEGHNGLRENMRPIFGPLDPNELRFRRGFRPVRHDRPNNNDNDVAVNERNDANNANNNNRRQYQIQIHVNVRMIFQLAVAGFILYTHCPPSRILGLGLIGLFFYMSTTELGQRMLRRILQGNQADYGDAPDREPREGDAGAVRAEPVRPVAEDGAIREGAPQAGHAPPHRRVGWIQEVQAFVLGFLASLLPAADDARAGRPENAGVAQDVFGRQQD